MEFKKSGPITSIDELNESINLSALENLCNGDVTLQSGIFLGKDYKDPQEGEKLLTPAGEVVTVGSGITKNSKGNAITMVQRTAVDKFFTATKFKDDKNYDIITQWGPLHPNGIITFLYVFIVQNSDSTPVSNPADYAYNTPGYISNGGVLLSNGNTSDQIGPVNSSLGSWTGGSHYKNGTTDKTAECYFHQFLCDGIDIPVGSTASASDVSVVVANNLWRPDQLPGTRSTIIKEMVNYNIIDGTIEVFVDHNYKAGFTVNKYYGMQFNSVPTYDRIYYSNSSDVTLRDYSINDDGDAASHAGLKSAQPYVDLMVQLSSTTGYCQVGWMDMSYGLGDRGKIGASSKMAFRSGSKAYFMLMDGSNVNVATNNSWHGAFTWGKKATAPGVDGDDGNGYFIVDINLKEKDLLACAVPANNSVQKSRINNDYVWREIEELSNSNVNGLTSWDAAFLPDYKSKFSWTSASSCVYEIKKRR